MRGMDDAMRVRTRTDSSAALGCRVEQGLGRLRHAELSQLRLQERVSAGDVQVMKVNGKDI